MKVLNSYTILADFLSKNRAEAIAVSIFEYDEEKHLKSERKLAYKNGEDAGIMKGIVRNVESAMKNVNLDLQRACEGLGTTIEEYHKAKEYMSKYV